MPSYFDTGNAIPLNLKTAIHPWPNSFFRANTPKMNPHFPCSIHWFICLLCISFNVLADAPSPTLNTLADVPSLTLKNSSMPVFIEAGRIQGHYDRGIEAIGTVELRGVPPLAVSATAPPVPKTRSRPVVPATKKSINYNKFAFAEAGRTQGHHERGIDALYEDTLRGDDSDSRLVYIDADRMEGHVDQAIEAIGDVELRSGDKLILAKRIKYFQDTEEVVAEDGVRIENHGRGDILEGSQLRLKLENTTGQLSQLTYRLKNDSSRGSANLLLFEGEHNYRIRQGSYTTCPAGDDDWILQADDLEVDTKQKTGTAHHVKIAFKGVPILYTPWMNFSFDKERKTGLLAPTGGYNVRTGAELIVPFYWNIAPNIDATFSARSMSKRGIMLTNELRYLDKNTKGNLLLEVLPNSTAGVFPGATASGLDRYSISFSHNQNFGYGWTGNFDYNKVSDNSWFVDLSADVTQTSRTNLLQQGSLSYQRDLWKDGSLNFKAMVQSFQTIRASPVGIVGVYQRLPELTLDIKKPNVFGAELDFKSSLTQFANSTPDLVNGNRMVLYPSVSVPLRKEFGHIIPKLGLHHTSYDLSLNSVGAALGVSPQQERTVPIFSLDSGVVLERNVALRGEQFTQTLEPRAMYVYVPFRDQSLLPNFDSAFTDFSFAQIFTENRFSGSDRINDANRVTLGLTSRLLEPNSGKERLSFNVGEQIHFHQPQVTSFNALSPYNVPGATNSLPASSKINLITAVTGNLTPQIKTDTTGQFNQNNMEVDVVRSALSYNPALGRIINLGYRYSRFGPGTNLNPLAPITLLNQTGLHQADISTQWRFSEKWQGVGKINYSLRDSRILEALTGIEYNACCWSLRFMFMQTTITAGHSTTAGFLQLDLHGLMQIGVSPLKALQQRIPGYTDTSPTAKNQGGP